MSSYQPKEPSKGRSEGKSKLKSKKAAHKDTELPNGQMKELQYWMERINLDAAKEKATRHRYNVLSRLVRHELNKFYFDVTSTPTKDQREWLLIKLRKIEPSGWVHEGKVVRWFQNKRQYMKKHRRDREPDFDLEPQDRNSTQDGNSESEAPLGSTSDSDASDSDSDSQTSRSGASESESESDSD